MITLIVFLLLLSVLVLIHELGHFLMAKKIGVRVEEFGLGYPPKIFGIKIGETEYTLNILPFGGFVRLFGENGELEGKKGKDAKRAFYAKSKIERILVLIAGVVMNFLLGVLVISYLFTQGVVVPTERVKVQEVLPYTPAQNAGLKKDDFILVVNGRKIKSPQELISLTKQNAGKNVSLVIERCQSKVQNSARSAVCQKINLVIIPRTNYPKSEGPMGVAVSNLEIKTYPWWQAPVLGTIEAFKLTGYIAKGIFDVLWQLVTQAKVPQEVAGPIGIYKVTGQAVQMGGFIGVLQLMGLLSLNLAVVNILPIPALDGGRFALIILEAIFGRKKIDKIEKTMQVVGTVFILSLIVLITLSDLSRLEMVKSAVRNFKIPF